MTKKLLLLVAFVGLFLSGANAQQYIITNSSLDVGNPPGGRGTNYDYTTTGGTQVLTGGTGSASANYWSAPVSIPFTFQFAGTTETHFVINKTGLITFDTSYANDPVASNLDTNTALPNANLPDKTIAAFWDDWTHNPPMPTSDYVYTFTYGTAPYRQFFILYYSWEIQNASYRYWGISLEETTNKIFVVDMGYNYQNTSGAAQSNTVGVQINSTTAFQVSIPLNGTQGSPNITHGNGGSGYVDNEYYEMQFFPAGACLPGANIATSNITAYSADISWTSTETSFTIQYDTAGFTLGMGDSMTVSTTSASLTNLTPNTDYQYFVRTNCTGGAQSIWQGPFSFTTGCAPFAVPFTEDFESATAGTSSNPSLPNCWTYSRTNHGGAGYTYLRNYSTWANSGSQFIYTYTSSDYTYGDTMAVISPEIANMDSINVQMEFYARSAYTGTSYDEVIYVGTIADPSDLSSMTIMDTVSVSQLQTYTYFAFQFDANNGYNGTDKHIVIVPSSLTTYDYVMIDDITIEAIPACPKPLYVTASNITDQTADVSWQSGGSNFYVEYGPCGFTQGTGMYDTVSTNSITLTGLSSNTEYDVYVQNDCSSTGDGTSTWSQISSCFKTECSGLPTPFTEDFDATTSGSSSVPSPPDCWKYTTSTHGGYGYGYTRNLSSYANSGSQFFYMYHSNTTDTMALVSPMVDSMDFNDKHIQFWARGYYSGTSYDEHIIVGTMSDPTDMTTFSALDTVSCSGTTYQFFDVYADASNGYNGTDKYFALAFWTGTSTYGYLLIDDITIADVPSCTPSTDLAVSAITNTGATATWTAGDGLSYDIEYGPTGFAQGTGAPLITGITSTSYSISNLMGNTCYDVYVRDSCSDVKSPWFGPITFCTACDPVNTPLLEDFENVAGSGSTTSPNQPDCWSYWVAPSSSYYGYSYSSLNPNGSYHWRFYNGSEADTIALISPAINGLGNGDKQIRLSNKSYYTSTSYQGIAMEIGTTPNYNTVRGGTAIDTIYGDFGTDYTNEFTVRFDTSGSGYNGTDQYIYMRPLFQTNKWYYYNFVDDINIENIPLCAAPWNLGVSNITSGSGDISWSTVYGTSFQIEYGPTGFVPGTGNGTLVNGATSGATISNLMPNTYYDVYVSDSCDTTNQAGPITFKTDCLAQLSGNYSIGGTGADFGKLDSAMFVLGGCGISGPTTFTLNNNDTASISLMAINGSSATNTVTLQGSSTAATDTIFLPALAQQGIDLNGTSYMTFKNLTVVATSSQYVVWLHENANHITFENCNLIMPTATSSAYAVVAATSLDTYPTNYGDNANDITLDGCKIYGGYYGVAFNGTSTTTRSQNITVENCMFRDQYYYGVRMYYIDGIEIHNNDILLDAYTYGYAFYIYYPWNMNMTGNKAFAPSYAMYQYRTNYLNTPTANDDISNNFFGCTGTSYGVYGGYWEYQDWIHNSISTTGSYAVNVYGLTNEMTFVNNIMAGGTSYAIYNSSSSSSITNCTVDYNIYHTVTGTGIAYWGGTTYTTLAAWQTADTTMNANSLQGDPGFASNTDFHIIGTLPNDVADNNTSITTDIDGDSRPATGSTTKDIGADEFTPLNWDASFEALMVPLGGCGDSSITVSAIVKNFGLSTITSLPVTVDYTGGMTGSLSTTATVSIAQGDVDTVVVGTLNTYAGAAGVNFMGYTSLVGDQKGINDTLTAGPGNYIPAEPITHGMVDTVCASQDSIELWAPAIPGTVYSWYDAMVGGNKIATDDTIMVPTNGMTTYYVAYDSASTTAVMGTGTSVSTGTYITPYKTYYMDGRAQYLVLASELNAMGIAAGEINSISFDVATVGGQAMNDLTIKVGGTQVTQMTSNFESNANFTTVFTATSYTAVSGLNVHTFSTPYIWNGSENIIIEVCFDNSSWSSNSDVYYTTTSFNSVCDGYRDLSTASGCTPGQITNQQASTSRPNMQFNVKTTPCTDVRKPVSFAVNMDTAMASFTHLLQTNGADVDFDGTASTGHIYEWTFGDGASSVGTAATVTHTYAAGTYTACLKVTDTICNTVDSVCSTVIANIGIEEGLLGQTLNVFPNPSSGKFRVEFEVEGLRDVELRVLTLLGQEIYVIKPGKVSGAYREEIDLSTQATGVYMIQIVTDQNVVSRRITIRR